MSIRDRLASAVDWAFEVFAPGVALERRAARKASEQFSQAFRGAQANRLTNNWQVTNGSADYDLLPDLPTLRERSRELLRNDPHAAFRRLGVFDGAQDDPLMSALSLWCPSGVPLVSLWRSLFSNITATFHSFFERNSEKMTQLRSIYDGIKFKRKRTT